MSAGGDPGEARTGASMFSWQRIPDEHLDEDGRRVLAEFIAGGTNSRLARER